MNTMKLEDARAEALRRGVDPATVEATLAPLRAMVEAVGWVERAKAAHVVLAGERDVLEQEAVRRQEDLAAAEVRAQRVTAPYRDVLTTLARRRAELADRLAAAEREQDAARTNEADVFRTHRTQDTGGTR